MRKVAIRLTALEKSVCVECGFEENVQKSIRIRIGLEEFIRREHKALVDEIERRDENDHNAQIERNLEI